MPSIDIRELRNPRRVKVLLGKGKTVDLCDGHRLIARIEPTRQWPDFALRRRRIFGERILPGGKLVIAERGRY
jgi:hypothetical protein